MHDVDAGLHSEQLHRQLRRGTHTRGCVIELAGTRFRKVNELRDRRRRKRGMNGENIGVTGDQADRREIALGIIAELAVQQSLPIWYEPEGGAVFPTRYEPER